MQAPLFGTHFVIRAPKPNDNQHQPGRTPTPYVTRLAEPLLFHLINGQVIHDKRFEQLPGRPTAWRPIYRDLLDGPHDQEGMQTTHIYTPTMPQSDHFARNREIRMVREMLPNVNHLVSNYHFLSMDKATAAVEQMAETLRQDQPHPETVVLDFSA